LVQQTRTNDRTKILNCKGKNSNANDSGAGNPAGSAYDDSSLISFFRYQSPILMTGDEESSVY
jgi:hypothetical protein